MAKNFLRQDSGRYSKLGKGRKKLQRWRKPKGRHSKMREKRKSYPKVVSAGYKREKKEYGKINGINYELVYNLNELKKLKKNDGIIIGKVGVKKKIDILKKAMEMELKILNMNSLGGKNAVA